MPYTSPTRCAGFSASLSTGKDNGRLAKITGQSSSQWHKKSSVNALAGWTTLLKGPRDTRDHCVIGKRRIAVGMAGVVCNTRLAVALHGPRSACVKSPPAVVVHHAGLNRNNLAGSAEAVAGAEGITNRHAFHTAADAQSKSTQQADAGDRPRKSSAPQVLIGG